MNVKDKNGASLEIEYKFLIRYPDVEILQAQKNYRSQKLTQIYLELPSSEPGGGGRCRIRRVEDSGGIRYIKTRKIHVTDLTRIEVESEITEQEYERLSKFAQPDCFPISKIRHSFDLGEFTYEVDVFPFWSDRAYLETEVSSEDVKPPIPCFLSVIKDVTHDKRYRNSALSKSIILECIE